MFEGFHFVRVMLLEIGQFVCGFLYLFFSNLKNLLEFVSGFIVFISNHGDLRLVLSLELASFSLMSSFLLFELVVMLSLESVQLRLTVLNFTLKLKDFLVLLFLHVVILFSFQLELSILLNFLR